MRFLLKIGRFLDIGELFGFPSRKARTNAVRRALAVVDAALSEDERDVPFYRSDVDALRADWNAVGQDIRRAIDEYGKNLERN